MKVLSICVRKPKNQKSAPTYFTPKKVTPPTPAICPLSIACHGEVCRAIAMSG